MSNTIELENVKMKGLLSVAKCPNCDGSGVVARLVMNDSGATDSLGYPIGIMDCEPEQCQWCDEVKNLVKP